MINQNAHVEWLGKEHIRTDDVRVLAMARFLIARDHDHFEPLLGPLTQLLKYAESIEPWHAHVQHNDVQFPAPSNSKSFSAVKGDVHLAIWTFQGRLHRLKDERVIVN